MYICRDHARTPMHWSGKPKAGFTSGRPWLMVNPNYPTINVEQNMAGDASVWNYYQHLLGIRNSTGSWQRGEITFLPCAKNVMAYERFDESGRYRIVVNMANKRTKAGVDLDGIVITSNYNQIDYAGTSDLRPYESVVLQLA